ncbi:MAG: hypothetical protein ABS904_00570 [Solibacillus isronensis]
MEILLLAGVALIVISFLKIIKRIAKLIFILVAILFIVSYFKIDPSNIMGVPDKMLQIIGGLLI